MADDKVNVELTKQQRHGYVGAMRQGDRVNRFSTRGNSEIPSSHPSLRGVPFSYCISNVKRDDVAISTSCCQANYALSVNDTMTQ